MGGDKVGGTDRRLSKEMHLRGHSIQMFPPMLMTSCAIAAKLLHSFLNVVLRPRKRFNALLFPVFK